MRLFVLRALPVTALIVTSFSLIFPASLFAARVSPATGNPQSAPDNTLAAIRRTEARDAAGKLARSTPAEHLRRANVYMTNRAFEEAREHWQAILKFYPEDATVPEAMLGIGRSYLQSRRYAEAADTLDKLAQRYPATKSGREGLNFSAAALVRLGRPSDAVSRYVQYVQKYPDGERIESAHLNVIDTLREAGRPAEANDWVGRTIQKFAGTPTETNALFGRLRLEVAEGNWTPAVTTAEQLNRRSFSRAVLTSQSEVAYLRAFSLERGGNREAAVTAYQSIPDGANSYYGWLATERLLAMNSERARTLADQRLERVKAQIAAVENQYPAPYRQSIVRAAKARKLDPRFILAIIKQESVFKPLAKSPAGARGLLQLTIDAAQRYAPGAGLNALRESELYRPETSILIGSEYLAHLTTMFPKVLEPVAASYNGGEDNVARWVKRAKHKDAGVFTAEVGFEETKGYVQKVMSNYRAYRQLYTEELVRK